MKHGCRNTIHTHALSVVEEITIASLQRASVLILTHTYFNLYILAG